MPSIQRKKDNGAAKNSAVVKRSIELRSRKTSISLEEAFWRALQDIARERGISTAELIEKIDEGRAAESNLSSAIRVFALETCLKKNAALIKKTMQ
ncbi:MAG: ribbon-helix-helix domain-containing protein [Pseudolabrys sp.]|nr:ribbon-helix-helix domain-containing protein [Pseudolabrys sp.]